ncbi:hypothetical protein SAMN04487996_11790 [Dyadobacter soli]|uniref:Uncharacterized protein n=1 Tax=Dyadobacter soli TaxID=659014 RepID=A0A1G7T4C1_9BACT|nr:hypothetical protein SAMN04487996_11790 [Dyadobacter soli]
MRYKEIDGSRPFLSRYNRYVDALQCYLFSYSLESGKTLFFCFSTNHEILSTNRALAIGK